MIWSLSCNACHTDLVDSLILSILNQKNKFKKISYNLRKLHTLEQELVEACP